MTTARLPTESGRIRWPADLETDEYHGWYMGRGRSVKRAVKAAMEGDLETIRACVDAEPELVNNHDSLVKTPAVQTGRWFYASCGICAVTRPQHVAAL